IDSIADDVDRDRSGMIYIGDDSGGTSGPNSGSAERFVFLAFYDSTPGDSGDDIELRAREISTGAQSWNTTSNWTLVTGGLSYDTWYNVTVDIDVAGRCIDKIVPGNIIHLSVPVNKEVYPIGAVFSVNVCFHKINFSAFMVVIVPVSIGIS
ncbi:unnamed protein product, partial [marine sediment metagenome]